MTDLHRQAAEWSIRNFGDKQACDFGVVEEIGELCHGILKNFQGIRGFHEAEKFQLHTADALADIGIYLINYAGTNGLLLMAHEQESLPLGFSQRKAISQLLMAASLLMEFADTYGPILSPGCEEQVRYMLQNYLQAIWNWTETLAVSYQLDLRTIVTATWIKVRQRDWEKNRTHAHIVAEQGGAEVPAVPGTISTNGDVGSAAPEQGAPGFQTVV